MLFRSIHSILNVFNLQVKQRFYAIWSFQVFWSVYKLHNNQSPIPMLQAYYINDIICLHYCKPYSRAKSIEYTIHHLLSLIVFSRTEQLSLILMNLKYIEYSNVGLIVYYYSNKLINNKHFKISSTLLETLVYVYYRCIAPLEVLFQENKEYTNNFHDKLLVYLLMMLNVFFSVQLSINCVFTITKYLKIVSTTLT